MCCSVRCRCRQASCWTLIMSAPASANSGMNCIRILDHQVAIQRQLRHRPHRLHHRRPKRDIRHKVPIHHIHMDDRPAAPLRPRDLIRQVRKVRRQNRKCQFNQSARLAVQECLKSIAHLVTRVLHPLREAYRSLISDDRLRPWPKFVGAPPSCAPVTRRGQTPILHGRQSLSWPSQHSMLPWSREQSYPLRLG